MRAGVEELDEATFELTGVVSDCDEVEGVLSVGLVHYI